jgi:hypothetical protein
MSIGVSQLIITPLMIVKIIGNKIFLNFFIYSILLTLKLINYKAQYLPCILPDPWYTLHFLIPIFLNKIFLFLNNVLYLLFISLILSKVIHSFIIYLLFSSKTTSTIFDVFPSACASTCAVGAAGRLHADRLTLSLFNCIYISNYLYN